MEVAMSVRAYSYKITITAILLILFSGFIINTNVGVHIWGKTNPSTACTVITTKTENTVLFGYNEDRYLQQFEQISYVRFHTSTHNSLSYMEITAETTDLFSVRVGVNEAGVAISGNGLSKQALNPHPDKQYSWEYDSLYRLILKNSRDISEVETVVNNYDFGPSMAFQIHVADANGDALVVSPGDNGEIVITRKNHDYFISTNMNRAQIKKGSRDLRNTIAVTSLDSNSELNKDTLKSTLQRVQQESYEGCTYYSVIFDLSNRIAYLYLMHDFDQEISMNITQELLQGDHFYLLSELFPDGGLILEKAHSSMILQANIFNGSRLVGLIISFGILVHLVSFGRGLWRTTDTRNEKIRLFLPSLGTHFFGTLFTLLTSVMVPALIFSNLTDYVIHFEGISFELVLVVLWVFGIFVLGYRLIKTRRIS